MAATYFGPSGGFSYAQAAKGASSAVASQASSSKVTSGTASPATGAPSDHATNSNWADDVEASIPKASGEMSHSTVDQNKSSQLRESPDDRAKVEVKVPNGTPGDTSSESTISTKDEESSAAPAASASESTSDTKSQASEPSWIAERKERQTSNQSNGGAPKAEKKSKEKSTSPPPQTFVLHEAAPPTVNPWLRRAEEAKAKVIVPSKPPTTAAASSVPRQDENQRPQADSRRKANSIASVGRESVSVSDSSTVKPNDTSAVESRSDSLLAASNIAIPHERSSLSDLSGASPSVKDDVAWPTPESAQDKERKGSNDKYPEEKRDDDTTPTLKRKKPDWKSIVVVPTVVWQTQSMNERQSKVRANGGGERGGRSGGGNGNGNGHSNGNGHGTGSRGRGGYRGAANGGSGTNRQAIRTASSPATKDVDSFVDTREGATTDEHASASQPLKSSRATSANSYHKADTAPASRSMEESFTEKATQATGTSDDIKSAYPESFSEARRTNSPKEIDAAGRESTEDDLLPKPIPRQSSVGRQAQESTEETTSHFKGASRPKSTAWEGQKAPADPTRDVPFNGTRGNGKRNGRGRGGINGRDQVNGHAAFANSFVPEYAAPSPYVVPPSPYSTPRSSHSFAYTQPGRGGWTPRGNPRSQSIPVENVYNPRYGYPAQAQLSPIQTFMPPMFNINGVPGTAMPYPAEMDPNFKVGLVTTQVDYYFSVDNLLKDMFLRKHMDSQGFVFLDVVADFNRVKRLSPDRELIKLACIYAKNIEIVIGEDGKERLRSRDSWQQFLLPMEQRHESVRNAGPERVESIDHPQLQWGPMMTPYREPASAGLLPTHQRFDRRSYDSNYYNGMPATFAPFSGGAEVPFGDLGNGEEMRGRAPKSPMRESVVSPVDQQSSVGTDGDDHEPDSFPDDQVGTLTVVLKMTQQRLPYHSLASRTFSNGSIDSRSIQAELEKPAETPKANGELIVNGSDRLPPIPRNLTPNKGRSRERGDPRKATSSDSDMTVWWVKDEEKPVDNIAPELTSEPYSQLRLKALGQRNEGATGTCPYDLDVLYQFWSHFLLRNFNNRMYSEFKYYANDDANQRHSVTGLQNLVQFYSQALTRHNPIRDRVIKDYVELVKNEPPKLGGSAFKTLRGHWRNGALNLKNRKKLADIVDDKLKAQLDET